MTEIEREPLPWQQQAWQQIGLWLEQDRLPHALLLTGGAGVGKALFARQLGAALLCQQPEGVRACGHCKQCQLLQAGNHPDLGLLVPEGEGRQIRIDRVRELIASLGQTAQMGRYRVTIIAPAEALNQNAANALLKTLEEPAAGNLLLLVSHFPGMLPATVRSRCQQLHFPQPSLEAVKVWLSGFGADPARLDSALAAAAGRPLRAWELLQGDADRLSVLADRLRQWQQLMAGELDPLTLAASWQSEPLPELVIWLRQQLAGLLLSAWRMPVTAVPVQVDARSLLGFDQQLQECQRQLLAGANPNPQLFLEDILLTAAGIFAAKLPLQRWR